MSLYAPIRVPFDLFSRFINEASQTHPQGEEGIKGEKGMRGLWGQVVIHHSQIIIYLP